MPRSDEDDNATEFLDGVPAEVVLPVPEHWMDDSEVESTEFAYSDRAVTDFVISGPLGVHGMGPGRRFESIGLAEHWARKFYGARLRRRITEAEVGDRWAYLVKAK